MAIVKKGMRVQSSSLWMDAESIMFTSEEARDKRPHIIWCTEMSRTDKIMRQRKQMWLSVGGRKRIEVWGSFCDVCVQNDMSIVLLAVVNIPKPLLLCAL